MFRPVQFVDIIALRKITGIGFHTVTSAPQWFQYTRKSLRGWNKKPDKRSLEKYRQIWRAILSSIDTLCT